jgi:hypothetical protein
MITTTLALFLAILGHASQEPLSPSSPRTIAVRLLDSRNSKPMISNDVEIWVDRDRSHVIYTHTGRDGVATSVLPTGTSEVTIYAQQNGWYLFRCDLTKDISKPAPFYPLDQIVSNGIAAPNRCSRRVTVAKAGEITLFLRPQTFWEKMSI